MKVKEILEYPSWILGRQYEGDIFIVSYLHELCTKPQLKRKFTMTLMLKLNGLSKKNFTEEELVDLKYFLDEIKLFDKEFVGVVTVLNEILNPPLFEAVRKSLTDKYIEMTQCQCQ
tara:strand:- start:48847 stop:49194 length:348 start_codon:yes stop_codon:yes gene_type:complete